MMKNALITALEMAEEQDACRFCGFNPDGICLNDGLPAGWGRVSFKRSTAIPPCWKLKDDLDTVQEATRLRPDLIEHAIKCNSPVWTRLIEENPILERRIPVAVAIAVP